MSSSSVPNLCISGFMLLIAPGRSPVAGSTDSRFPTNRQRTGILRAMQANARFARSSGTPEIS